MRISSAAEFPVMPQQFGIAAVEGLVETSPRILVAALYFRNADEDLTLLSIPRGSRSYRRGMAIPLQ
jgi:hypothetical protein